MAASLVGLSVPTLEKHLLNDLYRLSLSSSWRRNICRKCHEQQSVSFGKSMMIPKQKTIPLVCNVIKRHYGRGRITTAFHPAHQHVFYNHKTQDCIPHLDCNNRLSTPSLSANAYVHPSRFSHSFNRHNIINIPSQDTTISNSRNQVFQNTSVSYNYKNNIYWSRQFLHTSRRCPSLSSSSSSTTATTTNTSPQASDIPGATVTTPLVDPFKLMETEMKEVMSDLRKELRCEEPLLQHMSQYYFNGKGKTFRPLVALLMARACNIHCSGDHDIMWHQRIVAMVSEMIHNATLVHDDVIDASDLRRSQATLNALYGQRQAILTGDYIISQASIAVSRTKNPQVIKILSTILVDLIDGEFMQLGSKEKENERFTHYFDKTYKKTASLIANCCKSVAILGNCEEEMSELCFQYGRNLGLAFQLIDDLLDFTSSHVDMGKPTDADLKQGLATAPVLFAATQFPELHAMIMRRFSQEGDVEFARNAVAKSDGIEQTRVLATQHSKEAIRSVQGFAESEAKQGLIRLAQILLERNK